MGLVINQKVGDTTYITLPTGEQIKVTCRKRGVSNLSLDFEFPVNVRIDRQEVWNRKQRERENWGNR